MRCLVTTMPWSCGFLAHSSCSIPTSRQVRHQTSVPVFHIRGSHSRHVCRCLSMLVSPSTDWLLDHDCDVWLVVVIFDPCLLSFSHEMVDQIELIQAKYQLKLTPDLTQIWRIGRLYTAGVIPLGCRFSYLIEAWKEWDYRAMSINWELSSLEFMRACQNEWPWLCC